jgi:hypothetical protein
MPHETMRFVETGWIYAVMDNMRQRLAKDLTAAI